VVHCAGKKNTCARIPYSFNVILNDLLFPPILTGAFQVLLLMFMIMYENFLNAALDNKSLFQFSVTTASICKTLIALMWLVALRYSVYFSNLRD